MKNPQSLLEQGFQHHQAGRMKEAEDFYRRAIKVAPNHPDGLHLLGIVVNADGRTDEAMAFLERAVKANPKNAEFSNNLGQIYKSVGRIEDAINAYQGALKADPNFSDAHSNLGNALAASGEAEMAIGHYQTALKIDPNNARAHYNLATTLTGRGEYMAAIESFRKVLVIAPDYAEAHNNLADCLIEQGSLDEAYIHLQRALELAPDLAEAHGNAGNLLAFISDWGSSLERYTRATELAPDRAENWVGLGNAQENTGKPEDALVSYRRAVEADPGNDKALGSLCSKLMDACAWKELEPLLGRLDELNQEAGEQDKKLGENPFLSLSRSPDLDTNYRVSKSWSSHIERAVAGMEAVFPMQERRQPKPVLTIGYLSSDFRNHVIGHLVRTMFAMHDRNDYKIIGYSSGADDDSDVRRDIRDGCDEFVDIREMSSLDVAQRINQDQVDILVDLNGFTVGSRLEIEAMRPAPLQLHYMGYPGTVGGSFFDYIILDDIVLNPDEEAFFTEKVIYLPPYYYVSGRRPEPSATPPARQDFGLPDDGFVFCSFNKANKIEPVMFECWMTLLKETPGSVLWLIADNPVATENLKQEAAAHEVDPDRLVFAGKVPKDQHLARHGLADLGLDTRVYNGGVTTWDALAVGLPVITIRGNHVPSRATSSMLTSLGMESLVAADLDAYQALALNLAGNKEELKHLRDSLAENAKTAALFDTETCVRRLERAYQKIWEIYASGADPKSVKIS
jgi:protein O-GlcNAc transferase